MEKFWRAILANYLLEFKPKTFPRIPSVPFILVLLILSSVVCDESQREFTRCFGRKVDSTRSTSEWGAHLDVSIKSGEIINLSLFIGPSSVNFFVAARSFIISLEISNDDQRPSHVVRRRIRHLSKRMFVFVSFLRKFLPIYRKNSFTRIVFLPNFLEIKVRSSSINKRREEISLISKEMILRFICYVFWLLCNNFSLSRLPFPLQICCTHSSLDLLKELRKDNKKQPRKNKVEKIVGKINQAGINRANISSI